MNAQYRHSQPGYLSIVMSCFLFAVCAVIYFFGLHILGILSGALTLFLLILMYKLTIEIKGGVLRFWFGPGLFWKTIPLEKIAYCEPFKGVFGGWGFRYVFDGWLYNVSGFQAVTIVLKSGKKIHIGTDDLQLLMAEINSVIKNLNSETILPEWAEVKTDYLKRVEQALSATRHPRSYEIISEISNHMDRRFAELEPQQRTWENFQKIATEMGPPSEYAELVGGKKSKWYLPSAVELISFCLILAAFALSAYYYPRMPEQMASHWNFRGQVDGYSPRFPAMFSGPAIVTVLIIILMIVPRFAPVSVNIEAFRKIFGGTAVWLSVLLLLIQCHIIAWNLGIKINPGFISMPMIILILGWIIILLMQTNKQRS
jgi:hypothetical protein